MPSPSIVLVLMYVVYSIVMGSEGVSFRFEQDTPIKRKVLSHGVCSWCEATRGKTSEAIQLDHRRHDERFQ